MIIDEPGIYITNEGDIVRIIDADAQLGLFRGCYINRPDLDNAYWSTDGDTPHRYHKRIVGKVHFTDFEKELWNLK